MTAKGGKTAGSGKAQHLIGKFSSGIKMLVREPKSYDPTSAIESFDAKKAPYPKLPKDKKVDRTNQTSEQILKEVKSISSEKIMVEEQYGGTAIYTSEQIAFGQVVRSRLKARTTSRQIQQGQIQRDISLSQAISKVFSYVLTLLVLVLWFIGTFFVYKYTEQYLTIQLKFTPKLSSWIAGGSIGFFAFLWVLAKIGNSRAALQLLNTILVLLALSGFLLVYSGRPDNTYFGFIQKTLQSAKSTADWSRTILALFSPK